MSSDFQKNPKCGPNAKTNTHQNPKDAAQPLDYLKNPQHTSGDVTRNRWSKLPLGRPHKRNSPEQCRPRNALLHDWMRILLQETIRKAAEKQKKGRDRAGGYSIHGRLGSISTAAIHRSCVIIDRGRPGLHGPTVEDCYSGWLLIGSMNSIAGGSSFWTPRAENRLPGQGDAPSFRDALQAPSVVPDRASESTPDLVHRWDGSHDRGKAYNRVRWMS